ncbi:MAG: hypothetical protein M0R50_06905 [Candidatus Cloacimonetes bacterium]|jgi:hypothetical protein|nr:hypothetical protein [Candidatus Cloacimonadota bacterium]
MRQIYIANKLEVVGQDSVAIPGCEPEASFTTSSLSFLRMCKSTYVKLSVALAAIPGSTIEWQVNNAQSNGSTSKWFVLPPYNVDCPCTPMPDYYSILRSLGGSDDTVENNLPDCAVLDQGWCPAKNFEEQLPPPVKRYVPEGEIFGITPSLLFGPYYYGNDPRDSPVTDDIPLSM